MRCQFKKADGKLCKGQALTDSEHCWSHDERKKAARAKAARKAADTRRLHDEENAKPRPCWQ